ncbi:MAG: YbaB/EbfC family nucleoid-associated protein [Acidobacteriota bacterium]
MLKNMNQLMKQAQALQERLKQQLDQIDVEASAGGGMVSVRMNGNKTVTGIRIDPEVVSRDDVEMLQDLIVAAVNEAARKVDAEAQRQLGSMAGNLKIPGLF